MKDPHLIDCKWVDTGTGEVHEMGLTMADFDRLCGWERLGIIKILKPNF